ncbi:transglycosylase SLT domain-containing protein [Halobacteriovorax sp. JY17]|uniref:transglycosylase SLT domain-containing protein n=1 Tax=Halobacteriovorax sp. JY17 TaxID=2014617 RepID=UPI0025C528BF|nr:transglycosylase SLT domain-containing protein [Halobacteriovorax sp. JY17]
MKIFFLAFIYFFCVHTMADPGFVSVTKDNSVQVIQDGREVFLKTGDLIQVKENSGWKRNIKIISSIADGVVSGEAYMGEKTYKEHLSDNSLAIVNSSYKNNFLTKTIEVELSTGEKVTLSPGDEIKILDVDGWKRKIEIIKSQSGVKGGAILGNNSYLDYKKNGVLTEAVFVKTTDRPPTSGYEYDSLDSLVQKLMNQDVEENIGDDELSDGVEVSNDYNGCPDDGKTFKIGRYINVTNSEKKTLGVPKGSTVRVKTGGVTCSIEILELPKESNLNAKIYGNQVITFPSNLHPDFLTEVAAPSETVSLTDGVKFKLGDDASVHAYGRRTGKRYKFDAKDSVTVVGKHSNGDYIVKRNNEKWEYRIPYEDLDELNDNSQLSINLLDTVTGIVEDERINEVVSEVEPDYECHDEVREDDVNTPEIGDIEWQVCRAKSTKNNRGKTLAANDYMDREIPLSNNQTNKILEDSQKRQFSKCISLSLRHGTNRSSNPSCSKDGNGNIIPRRIRQATYRTSSGKRKFAGWQLLNKAPKACASKKLSTHLADRYVDMTKCLGIDAKELFPVINHESHFQPKTISPTFALGVGQIVSVNYLDFYNKMNQAKDMIQSNSSILEYAKPLSTREGYKNYEDSPSRSKKVSRLTAYFLSDLKDKMTGNMKECSGLKQLYDNPVKLPSSAKSSTSSANDYLRDRENIRLCAPKNPDEGFYMAAIYYMYNKKYFRYMLEKENREQGLNMTTKQVNDFSIILARWSYNGGVAGVSGPFERLVEKIKMGSIEVLNSNNDPDGNKKKKVSGFSNFSNDDFKNYMSYVIKHRYNGGNARRNEVARYITGSNGVGGVDGDLKQIEKGEKNSCGTTY